MSIGKIVVLALAGLVVGPATARADEAKAAEPGTLVVIDHAGKEHKLKTWKFVAGTRRLSWLAPAAEPKEGKEEKDKGAKPAPAPRGPEALEFRDDNSTDLREGILTFVLLDRIKAIDYDPEKKTVAVHIPRPGGKGDEEDVLTGSTKFVGENKLTIEAEADLGELGVATVKFQGGVPKGIKGIRFPTPRPTAEPTGRPAQVTAADKEKSVHKVTDLQPLYLLTSGERLVPTLLFQKTVKVDLGKVQKLAFIDSKEKGAGIEFEVTLKDGKSHTLTLRDRASPLGGKAGRLLGFVGQVPAGYKYFPLRASPNNTFTEIVFEGAKEEAKKDEDKKEKKE